jgi:hypothetical protein
MLSVHLECVQQNAKLNLRQKTFSDLFIHLLIRK